MDCTLCASLALDFGGAFVEGFINNIAAAFGLSCKTVTREKFGTICNTQKGLVRIQKTGFNQGNIDAVMFGHEVKEHLWRNKFEGIDRFFVTESGLPYHKVADEIFTASIAYSAKNAQYAQPKDFLSVVDSLGKMHKILAQPNFVSQPRKKQKDILPQKAMEVLEGYKKKLLRLGKFSEFDMLFLKGCDIFMPHITAMGDIDCFRLEHNDYICHNLLKEENVYIVDGKPIFTNFANASYGHYSNDLVYIVKRYLKVHPAGDLPLSDVFDAYKNAHCTGYDIDEKVFRTMLLYPDKFIKVARDYYIKKRSFAPKNYLTHMEESFARNTDAEAYLQRLVN